MIEDDSFLRKLYRDKFEKEGFDFLEATNGVEGINKIVSESPDVIIIDLLLPMKSGFDVLNEMKEREGLESIPVLVLSNLAQDTDIQEAKDLGAKEYFIKSEIKFSDVVEKVKEII